jgi:hypothetical protein
VARRRLQRMRWTRESVLAGRLSMDHVDLFLQFATAARFELFLEHEAEIVRQCEGLSLFDDARRVLQYWAMAADDLLGRGASIPPPSSLYGSRSQTTGEWLLHGALSPVDAEVVESELHRLMRELKSADRAKGVVHPAGQLRAAALVRMATRFINATGATARPLFQVIVGDETAGRLCELASGHVVRPDELAPHLDGAVMESFLFDGPSVVIAKSNQRTFTGALRRPSRCVIVVASTPRCVACRRCTATSTIEHPQPGAGPRVSSTADRHASRTTASRSCATTPTNSPNDASMCSNR